MIYLTQPTAAGWGRSVGPIVLEPYNQDDDPEVKRNRWILSQEPNGHSFPVLPTKDANSASSLLGTVSERITRLATVLYQRLPNHIGAKRLFERWSPQLLAEGRFDIDGITSYTVNKGERIVLCLRSKQGVLHSINMIMYVLLHELAHIMSVSHSITRHNEEFHDNLNLLLKHAIDLQLYDPNVSKKSQSYCGMEGVQRA